MEARTMFVFIVWLLRESPSTLQSKARGALRTALQLAFSVGSGAWFTMLALKNSGAPSQGAWSTCASTLPTMPSTGTALPGPTSQPGGRAIVDLAGRGCPAGTVIGE